MNSALGKLAVERGWINPAQLDEALEEQRRETLEGRAAPLGQILLRHRWVTSIQFVELLQAQRTLVMSCPYCGHGNFAGATIAEGGLVCPKCNGKVDPDTVAVSAPPPRIGKYDVIAEVARGGMGVVYRARHSELDQDVAVKVLRNDIADDPHQVERLYREARAAASLRHPNIVRVLDVGREGDRHFLAMEFLEGVPLDQWIEKTRPPLPERLKVLAVVARAVQYAHKNGVIHRDLKPQNVLMTPSGDPVLTDFGLAKQTSAEYSITRPGAMLGTPFYMAPELVRGDNERVGPRTDVFSLGAMLYEMITEVRPFTGNSVYDIAQAIMMEEPRPPRAVRPAISRDLETICLKALEKDPAGRYATAEEFAEDLTRFIDGRPIRARPPSASRRMGRFVRRWKAWVAAGAFAAVAVAAGLALLLGGGGERRREEARRQIEAIRPQIDDARNDLYRRGVTLEAMDRKLRAAVAEIDRIEREVAPVAEGEILKAQALSSLSEANLSERIFNEVREAFRRAEELDPAHPALPVVRGAFYVRRLAFEDVVFSLTYGALGKEAPWLDEVGAAAQRDVERALRAGIDARLTRVLFEVAGAAMAGEYARAEEIVDREAAADPHEELWLQKAYLRLRESDFAASQEAAGRALDLRPNYVDAHLVRAVCLIRTRKYEDAGVVADQLLTLAPGGPIALFLRCVAHVTNGEWEAAADVARAAVEGAKDEPLPQALAGLALILTGHPEEGVEAVEAGFASARAIRALGLYESGDVEGARREMEAASATRPAAAAVFGVRAQVEFYQRGDAARAEEFVNFALGYADRCAVLYVVRGQVRTESRLNLIGGAQDLQRAAALDPWWGEFIRGEMERQQREESPQ